MKTYAVTPSIDADGWFVKVENVAPTALLYIKGRGDRESGADG